MIDLHNNIQILRVLSPGTQTCGTKTGIVIDRQNYNSVEFAIALGAATTGLVVTPVVKSGAATGALTSAADAVLIGTEAGAAFTGAHADKVSKIGYIGADRYVTCDLVVGGKATSIMSVVAILGNPRKPPKTSQRP